MITFSIIQKSQLEGAMRLDAEYYQPEYLDVENQIKKNKFETIKNISEKVFSGPFGSTLKSESYQSDGIPFIRIGDISDIFIDKDNLVYISEEENKRIYSTHLNIGDIVLSKIATIGRLSVIDDSFGEVNISENNIGIRLQNLNNKIKSFILFFLLSKFGQAQIFRKASGNIQLKLNVLDIESLIVPLSESAKYDIFEDLYSEIVNEKRKSISFYQRAERLLLKELNLENSDAGENLSTIVNFSDVLGAERIDAEYFQKKYEKLFLKIKSQNFKKLSDLVSVRKGIEVGAEEYQEEGKVFIRVSSMTKFGVVESDQKYLSDKLYDELKNNFEPKKGEILLTKDATPGIAYVLKEDIQGIISGGTLRLKLKDDDVEAEYLALCLNSLVGQMQAERDAGGSVIAHWKPEQIKNVVVPILPKEIQEKIANLVQKSHGARRKAKELLEEAKRKVEEMIEKGGERV